MNFQEIKALLAAYYGGDVQLAPKQAITKAIFESLVFWG